MTTIPTVTYFNAQGKAELIRLILAYNNVEFIDERINGYPLNEEMKSKVAFGQLPFYIDADIKMGQSIAIARYLANKFEMTGRTAQDKAHADAYVDSIGDLITPYFQSRDNAEKLAQFKTTTIPKILGCWEKYLVANGGKFFVGDSLTWADLGIYFALTYLSSKLGFPDALPEYKSLATFVETIGSIPQIKKLVDARPETMF
eukprot:gene19158-22949_t